MQGQQEDVFLLGQLEQCHAQQRTGSQIERQHRLLLGGSGHGLLALGDRQGAEIHVLDHQRRRSRHLQQAVIGLRRKHGAQGFVTRHQAGERPLQRRQIQTTAQAYRAG